MKPAKTTAPAGPIAQLRAIFIGHLDEMISTFDREPTSDDGVHELRKDLKRLRALLRLLRGSVGEASYNRANQILRDMGRPLTPVRDAKILMQTLGTMRRAKDDQRTNALGRQLMKALQREKGDGRRKLSSHFESARTHLVDIKDTLAKMGTSPVQPETVAADLARVYKKGRRSYAQACAAPTDERLHECRKQAKYFHNGIITLVELYPGSFPRWQKRSDRLGDYLGEDHDLAVLTQRITEFCARDTDHAQAVAPLNDRILKQRKKLQRRAMRVAERLYAKKASQLRMAATDMFT
jgi:CHAD domain-containing protein